MRKLLFFLLASVITIPFIDADPLLDGAAASLERASETPPVSFHYKEKAGAFGINRSKERRYEVQNAGDSLLSVVVFADEGKHHEDDPRPPAKIGDTAPYDFASLIRAHSPFNPDLNPTELTAAGTEELDAETALVYTFTCTTFEDGIGYPTEGELYLHQRTGAVLELRLSRLEYPEDINGQRWILSFSGDNPADSRLQTFFYESKGRYAIFVYKFRTTDTFFY